MESDDENFAKKERYDSEKEDYTDDENGENFPNKLPTAKGLMSLTSFK